MKKIEELLYKELEFLRFTIKELLKQNEKLTLQISHSVLPFDEVPHPTKKATKEHFENLDKHFSAILGIENGDEELVNNQ